MKKHSKSLLSGILALALLISCFAMGCGKEDKPTETVNQFCSTLLKYDIASAVKYTNDQSSEDALDIDSKTSSESGKIVLNTIKELAKKNSFAITKEEKISSTSYNVTVTFKLLNLSTFTSKLTNRLQTTVNDYYNSTGKRLDSSKEDDMSKILELMQEAANKLVAEDTFPTEDYDQVFKLEKVNDKWTIIDVEATTLIHILLMGLEGSI